jgi:hypothetical protein
MSKLKNLRNRHIRAYKQGNFDDIPQEVLEYLKETIPTKKPKKQKEEKQFVKVYEIEGAEYEV